MQVGLFVTLECERQQDAFVHLADIRQQVKTARDAGFDSLWVPQHFVTGPSMTQFSASPMLGFLAGVAEGMRLGTAVLLLPMLKSCSAGGRSRDAGLPDWRALRAGRRPRLSRR